MIAKLTYWRGYGWLVCGLAALFYCYEYFLRIAPSVMTADLMSAFHISASGLGGLIAFYYYAYTPAQIPVGLLMDRYGPRKLLTLSTLICAIGSFLFILSSQYLAYAKIGRFLTGLGSASAFIGVLKLASLWLSPTRFAMISGMATALGMLGAVFGNIVLSAFLENLAWHEALLYSSMLGIALALLLFLLIRDTHEHTVTKTEYQRYRELGIALARLLKHPQIWLNGLIGGLLYLPTSAFAELWGVPYLEQAYQLSRLEATKTISMIFLGWAIGGPINGWISDRIQQRRLPILLGGLMACALSTIILYLPIPKSMVPSLFLVFGMVSSAQIIVFAVGRENSPQNLAGTAVALTNTFVMLGGALFQPAIGFLLDYFWDNTMLHGIPVYSTTAYQYALGVLPLGLFLGAILCLFLKETYGKLQA